MFYLGFGAGVVFTIVTIVCVVCYLMYDSLDEGR